MGTMEVAGGVLFKAIGPGGLWVAPLPLHLAATALLVRDADKLTYGQQLWVYTPHAIEGGFKAAAGAILAEALAA